ncbi:hypothetical protein P9B03_04735 [Metasolibacillus meyeri]|uniref:Uncharacterized protein n=1 Tax=Metasolibacillus meyeri TaxID=1071052 RepID=A0AAW9NJ72_9BACL|nr:hypothetical protein [Metasolibacillus meyeri]MEC1177782.1 hypothetical protein [Metasolibacillus meyeri]
MASANVVKTVLTKQDYNVTLTEVDAPTTHQSFYDSHKDNFIDLGVRSGLVVPVYVDIDSIEDLEAIVFKFFSSKVMIRS